MHAWDYCTKEWAVFYPSLVHPSSSHKSLSTTSSVTAVKVRGWRALLLDIYMHQSCSSLSKELRFILHFQQSEKFIQHVFNYSHLHHSQRRGWRAGGFCQTSAYSIRQDCSCCVEIHQSRNYLRNRFQPWPPSLPENRCNTKLKVTAQ